MSFPARKIRTVNTTSRSTLKPTVRDFSDQVIGNYTIDDDTLCVSTVARAQSEISTYRRPHSTVTYTSLETAAQSHIPATFDTPRSSTFGPAEVHRRHVVKSARLRSRLSGNKQMKRLDSRNSVLSNGWQDTNPGFFATYPSGSCRDLVSSRPFERSVSSEFIGHQHPRVRPSTTGRYFDSSNGLWTSSTARMSYQNRPHTAGAWAGPGLRIQKMTLNVKDSPWVHGYN
ncbi:uncharacterized protein LOC101854067 [Aplysia californica]|uniref:Uncharacterized protein LOC101854067 n=1 Tax=Aplysia californica TaxID=6500 RepID=A0ABM0JEF1_APLCA|nr:uncharacterized protein LOC101854067 [Aplysia californica]